MTADTTPRRPRPIATITMMTVAVAAWTLLIIPTPNGGDAAGVGYRDPAALVGDYLTAIADGDAARASRIADSRPIGEPARFLHDDALNSDWRLVDVTVDADDRSTSTTAAVTIETADGTVVDGEFPLIRTGADWRMQDPFVTVRFSRSPLWYVDVNGMRMPFEASTPIREYLLFPGVYTFYGDLPDDVRLDAEPTPLLPGSPPSGPVAENGTVAVADSVALTESGRSAAQRAVRDHIDQCVLEYELGPAGCPFGTDSSIEHATEHRYLKDFVGIRWTVVEYPQVTVDTGPTGFRLTDERPGSIELTATATVGAWQDGDIVYGDRTEFSVTCEIRTDRLRLGLTADGDMAVAPIGGSDRAATEPERYPGDPALLRGEIVTDFLPTATIETCRV